MGRRKPIIHVRAHQPSISRQYLEVVFTAWWGSSCPCPVSAQKHGASPVDLGVAEVEPGQLDERRQARYVALDLGAVEVELGQLDERRQGDQLT